jgi:hypothetical protein
MTRHVVRRRLTNAACIAAGLLSLAVVLIVGTAATIDWIGKP